MTHTSVEKQQVPIYVEQYKTSQHVIFGVYQGFRCWQRLTSVKGNQDAFWVESTSAGHDRAISEKRVRWLEKVWRKRKRFPRVRRFARNAKNKPTDSAWDALPQFDPSRSYKTKWLVRSFLAEGTIQLVHGERGSFKSTLLLAFAHAVSEGKDFLGMKTRRRLVLYLDYENPASVLKERCRAFDIELPNDRLMIWDRFKDGFIPKPGDDQLQDIVKKCVEQTGQGPWIIFDSWSSLLRSGEGGEGTGQVAPVYLELRGLADLGAAITVVDHPRKYDPTTLYGSQDKEAKSDTIHRLELFANSADPTSPIVRVTSWLKRFAPRGATKFSFQVESFQDDKGEWHITGLKRSEDPVEAELKQKVEALKTVIRECPGHSQDDLVKKAMRRVIGSRDSVVEMLKAGIGKHWIVRRAAHNKSRYELI